MTCFDDSFLISLYGILQFSCWMLQLQNFCLALFYSFHLFVVILNLSILHFSDFNCLRSLVIHWASLRWLFSIFLGNSWFYVSLGLLSRDLFWAIDWAMFSWFFLCLVCFVTIFAFEKIVTSPSIYELVLCGKHLYQPIWLEMLRVSFKPFTEMHLLWAK